jgi:hypothetical protein
MLQQLKDKAEKVYVCKSRHEILYTRYVDLLFQPTFKDLLAFSYLDLSYYGDDTQTHA